MGTLPDETARSSPWVVPALRAAGLVVVQDGQGAAPAGDTVEIVRVVDGRAVSSSDRFVEAYRLGRNPPGTPPWEPCI